MTVLLITQAEYARRRGVAKSAVARAVKEGRISLIDGKIDPAVADIQWERNTRARADSGRPVAPPGLPFDGPLPPASAPAVPPPKDDDEYSVNRARRERYEADLAEIRLREMQGDLVRVVEVRAEIGKAVGQLKTNLLQISARLAHLLDAEQRAAVDAEIRGALSSAGQS